LAGFAYLGPAVCDAIPADKAFLHKACLNAALQALWQAHGNAWVPDSACASLTQASVRDQCFALLGGREERPSACDKVKDARLRSECWLAAGNFDAAYCRKLSGLEHAGCVRRSSHTRTLDSSVCGVLVASEKSDCERRVTSNLDQELSHGR
jgi:hypothetical protein